MNQLPDNHKWITFVYKHINKTVPLNHILIDSIHVPHQSNLLPKTGLFATKIDSNVVPSIFKSKPRQIIQTYCLLKEI